MHLFEGAALAMVPNSACDHTRSAEESSSPHDWLRLEAVAVREERTTVANTTAEESVEAPFYHLDVRDINIYSMYYIYGPA